MTHSIHLYKPIFRPHISPARTMGDAMTCMSCHFSDISTVTTHTHTQSLYTCGLFSIHSYCYHTQPAFNTITLSLLINVHSIEHILYILRPNVDLHFPKVSMSTETWITPNSAPNSAPNNST